MEHVKLVCELGINHNGNLATAKKLIDVACMAGVDYVKFQKRTIEAVYTNEELNSPRESPWGTTTRQQKEGLELSVQEYREIDAYCKNKIPWFASPWDVKSIFLITRFDIPYIKIPSALITSMGLLEVCKKTCSHPIIISTGMSTKSEVDRAIKFLGDRVEYILACTSTYPTSDNEMNLNFISTLKKEYPKHRIGFSNHSPGIIYMLTAVALGAEMIEFHITLDRASYGSDQAASIETTGVLKLAKHVRHLEKAMNSGHWKVYESEKKVRAKLRRSDKQLFL